MKPRPEYCADEVPKMAAELVRLRADVRDLRVALDDLMDIQNGPPLVTYTEAWNAAMDQARAVMERTASPSAPREGGR